MTISYNWLSDYLPVKIEPERLSEILTSIGLEVEKMEVFEEVKGGLKGLVIGQVLETEKHPNADKLKLTKVAVGQGEPLQIVCGAPNVAAGQKVVVAPVGTTIFPITGEPVTMKVAKIRGIESRGMICAEDEIGVGASHAGIMVLDETAQVSLPASEYFKLYSDIIYEIGLTPNRMDAMSHLGVARDICAYLSYHDKKDSKPKQPSAVLQPVNTTLPISVEIENKEACKRYSGICINNIRVKESPKWLQERLRAIGVRSVNNIVDVTNYVLHETGQPLHAFNYDAIQDKKIIITTLPDAALFVTLDAKERKLSSEDLMICNAAGPMCIAGVFGGLHSGVTQQTTRIFLESAWFDPAYIRKTSFRHGLRTDAATRFEKGVDISNTVEVVKRAATLIIEVAGGEVASDIIDVYPEPVNKKQVLLSYPYLKKLSGKEYHPDAVKNILQSLGFLIVKEDKDAIGLEVPYHKFDVSLPADVVEEILRIDGLDNIPIPTAITISPSVESSYKEDGYKEKISNRLAGLGFNEILTNSITNSRYYTEQELQGTVRLLNNLSVELDIMRPAMLQTALEVISFNNNRKDTNLKLFEFGKTYSTAAPGWYAEKNHLCLYITGAVTENSWRGKSSPADIYYIKGVTSAIIQALGLQAVYVKSESNYLQTPISASVNNQPIVTFGSVAQPILQQFDIKQPVLFADFDWDAVIKLASAAAIQFAGLPKYPAVERDLALVLSKETEYHQVTAQLDSLRLGRLQHIKLFDVFESEKLGKDKKSLAINLTFLDEDKTLTDKEIDGWMAKIMTTLEKELGAEIRK